MVKMVRSETKRSEEDANQDTVGMGRKVKEGNLDKHGHSSHGWNEAEIFILAILVGEISILGEKKFCMI